VGSGVSTVDVVSSVVDLLNNVGIEALAGPS